MSTTSINTKCGTCTKSIPPIASPSLLPLPTNPPTVPSFFTGLSINPSYRTTEVNLDSCPPGSWGNQTSKEALEWTHNYPRVHGNSVLGIYGATDMRFGKRPLVCNECNICSDNTVSPLFYRGARPVAFPTYGLTYRGKDEYYRDPAY